MIATRPATEADRDFIRSGWSTSYRPSRDETRPMAMYARQKHEEVDFYLDRAATLMAHGETGVLFGFITYDPSAYKVVLARRELVLDGYVLYVYVASPFRQRGIARRLFLAAGISPAQRFGYLCRTRWSWDLRSKIPLAVHEPFRARYEEIEHVRRTEAEPEAGTGEAGTGEAGPRPNPGEEAVAARADRLPRP